MPWLVRPILSMNRTTTPDSRAHLNLIKDRFSQNSSVKTRVKSAPSDPLACQGSLYYQPKQCTLIIYREIPQNYHAFALFDAPKMANLMTPACSGQKKRNIRNSKHHQQQHWETPKSNIEPGNPICLEHARTTWSQKLVMSIHVWLGLNILCFGCFHVFLLSNHSVLGGGFNPSEKY